MEKEKLRELCKKRMAAVLLISIILMAADVVAGHLNNDVKFISSNGNVYMIRPSGGEGTAYIDFRVKVQGENESLDKKVTVALRPYGNGKETREDVSATEKPGDEREILDNRVRSIVSGFNDESNKAKVLLPKKLKTGEEIIWERQIPSNTPAIGIVCILLLIVIYKGRFAPIERRLKKERDSVARQLPEFVNRLVLLLNAGLVLNSAFEKAVEESMTFEDRAEDYFYSEMKEIYMMVTTANASMHIEFRNFAKNSGIRELMRISNIISDNVSKGVELTKKLQAESQMLWIVRKKNCEERGRLAETKLTMPLVIFLVVLVVITIAPAMLEL